VPIFGVDSFHALDYLVFYDITTQLVVLGINKSTENTPTLIALYVYFAVYLFTFTVRYC